MTKRPKTPKIFKCAHCGRALEIAKYSGTYPESDTPKERVHVVKNSALAGLAMLCTCGHYTIVERGL